MFSFLYLGECGDTNFLEELINFRKVSLDLLIDFYREDNQQLFTKALLGIFHIIERMKGLKRLRIQVKNRSIILDC